MWHINADTVDPARPDRKNANGAASCHSNAEELNGIFKYLSKCMKSAFHIDQTRQTVELKVI